MAAMGWIVAIGPKRKRPAVTEHDGPLSVRELSGDHLAR
jgi:hypothetical protein